MKYDCLWVCPSHLGTPLWESQQSSLRALGRESWGALQERAAVEEGRRERSGHWSGRTKCMAFVGTKRTRVSEEERRKSQVAAGAVGTYFRF